MGDLRFLGSGSYYEAERILTAEFYLDYQADIKV